MSGSLKRNSYTMKEMKKILEYIKSKDAFSEVKGRRLWTEYADSGETTRTWQSLKETFIKRILPDIGNPYYGLLHEERRKFTTGANSSTSNLSKVKWIRKPNPIGPEVSNHKPLRSLEKVKEPNDCPKLVESSPDSDSDTDIELVSTRAKISSPIQIEAIVESSSNASFTPITPNCEIFEPVISPSTIDSSPEIVDPNMEDAEPKDAPLQESPDFEAQSSEIFAPNVLKNSFLLLNSDDTDVSDLPTPMEETSQRKGNLFGFSTGKPTLLPHNSQNRKEITSNSESQYKKEFQPCCSKNIAFSTPTKRSNESLKRSRPSVDESSTDPQSNDSSESDSQLTPLRSAETVSATKKGKKMFCSLNGNLVQLYQSKHKKCSERQKIYTQYEDVCKHNPPKKKHKSIYIEEPAKSPVKQSQALIRNGNHEMIDEVIAKSNGGQPNVLNYWKMKYIAEKKRANDLFRILSIERKHLLDPELIENHDYNSHGSSQTKRANSHKLPTSNSAPRNTRLNEMSSSSINKNALAPSTAKCPPNENVKAKRDLVIVQRPSDADKNDADKNLGKFEKDSNVIVIDTQKADLLFAILRKLTETGMPSDNGKNDKTKNSSPAKTSEATQSTEVNSESVAKRKKTKDVVDTDNYVFRSQLSKAKLSNLKNTKHKQIEENKAKQAEKEEIDELFRSQEKKEAVSIVIEDETPEESKVALRIREKEKQIFDKILLAGNQEEENANRCVFTDKEVKMLQSENSPKSDSGTDENIKTVSPKKRGRPQKKNSPLIKVSTEEDDLLSSPRLYPQPNENANTMVVTGNTNLQSGIERRSLRTRKEGAGASPAERNTNSQSDGNLQSGIAKPSLRTSKVDTNVSSLESNTISENEGNLQSGIARRSLRTPKEGAIASSVESSAISASEANLQTGIAKSKLRRELKEASHTPPVDSNANLTLGIAKRTFRSQQKNDAGTPPSADKVKVSPASGGKPNTYIKRMRKVKEDLPSTSSIEKQNDIDEEKDLFKINPKFLKELFPEKVSKKPSSTGDVVPSTSDSDLESPRYQLADAFSNLKRQKGRKSEGKTLGLKWFTEDSSQNMTRNFNSKHPITDYNQFKHPTHPSTQSTSHAHNDNDPGEKENNFGSTSERINKFGDSFHLEKELEYNHEQNSTPETIIEDAYLESEEIPFQTNLFYFARKPKNTPNLSKANLNQTFEQVISLKDGLDLTLPLMEQDVDLNAHKESSVKISTIAEKASYETIIIDVVGIDSPIPKATESFQINKRKHNASKNIQEIPLTDPQFPCSDTFLSLTDEKQANLIDNAKATNFYGSTSKLLSEKDDDSVIDCSFYSKVSGTLFESQNSISQSMKSVLSHLDAEFEHEKLNTGPLIFNKDVANVVGDISDDSISPVAAQSSITGEKPNDLEEWRHIMTEDESE